MLLEGRVACLAAGTVSPPERASVKATGCTELRRGESWDSETCVLDVCVKKLHQDLQQPLVYPEKITEFVEFWGDDFVIKFCKWVLTLYLGPGKTPDLYVKIPPFVVFSRGFSFFVTRNCIQVPVLFLSWVEKF